MGSGAARRFLRGLHPGACLRCDRPAACRGTLALNEHRTEVIRFVQYVAGRRAARADRGRRELRYERDQVPTNTVACRWYEPASDIPTQCARTRALL
jgi:hypothetical protein